MTYCAPRTPNFGFLDHGCAVYGGIQINTGLLSSQPAAENKSFYATQFNLANFWERPYLIPHSLAFPEFLTRFYDIQGKPMLPPGHWRFNNRHNKARNRNLLTGVAEDESTVRLWAANEQYSRKRLWEFRVRLKDDAENDEQNEIWQVVGDEMDGTPGPTALIQIPSPVLELRSAPRISGNSCLFARSEQGLFFVNPTSAEVTSILNSPVIVFAVMPYMPDEIVVLDAAHFLWHGDFDAGGSRLSRVKTPADIELISPSDHPRIVYAADAENVWTLDLREGSSKGNLLYSVPDYDDATLAASRIRYKGAFKKPTIHHLKSLEELPRVFLVATSKKFCLLDERMPGIPYLETAHSVMEAGDFLYSAPSFGDPLNSGSRIFPFYSLRHTALPDVQHFSLFSHAGKLQWSMLAPIKRLLEPVAAAQFFREQMKYGVRLNDAQEGCIYGFGPTRAIHAQNGLANDRFGNERQLFFRMTDDGSLWLESLRVVDDSHLSEPALERAAHSLRRRLNERPRYPWDSETDPLHENRPKIRRRNIVADPHDALPDEDSRFDNLFSPLDFSAEVAYPDPPVIEAVEDPNKIISKLTLDCFAKT